MHRSPQAAPDKLAPLPHHLPTSVLCAAARKLLSTAPSLRSTAAKVVLVTAIHDKPCTYPRGDYINLISVVNKQAGPPCSDADTTHALHKQTCLMEHSRIEPYSKMKG